MSIVFACLCCLGIFWGDDPAKGGRLIVNGVQVLGDRADTCLQYLPRSLVLAT